MKTLFALALTLTFAEAQAVTADVCYAQCLGSNTSARSIEFVGNISVAGKSRFAAWKKLNQKCEKALRYSGLSPVLADGSVLIDLDQSSEGSSWRSFSYTRIESGGSYYQSDKFRLNIDLASPASSCGKEEVSEEDLIEYYDGDLPVLG